MAKKFYVVWVGRETGVFTTWAKTQKQVDKFPKCRFKSYKTRQEAEAAFAAGPPSGRKTRPANPNVTDVETRGTHRKKTGERSPGEIRRPARRYDVEIYCDGACEPNPGESGSGIAVYRQGELSELWYGLYDVKGTNNTAELNALYQAFLIAKEEAGNGKDLAVLSDSKYGINCVTEWAFSWQKKGWKRKKPGDIKNLELIQLAHEIYVHIKEDVVVSHVSAHVGIEGNELADRMAVFGIDQQAREFCRYSEDIDVPEILAYRSG